MYDTLQRGQDTPHVKLECHDRAGRVCQREKWSATFVSRRNSLSSTYGSVAVTKFPRRISLVYGAYVITVMENRNFT